MVKLASYLTADSIKSYCADNIDGENTEAIFEPEELLESLAFRQSIPLDLMSLLHEWTALFTMVTLLMCRASLKSPMKTTKRCRQHLMAN